MMRCKKCGNVNGPEARFCQSCGQYLQDPVQNHWANAPEYAGFWRRFAAYLIDALVISFISGALLLLHVALKEARVVDGDMEEVSLFIVLTLPIFLTWLYYAGFESSSKGATLGKRAVGISVTDLNGRRISFGRATGRHFSKLLSSLLMGIGYVMAGFTEKKQALHDQVAGCLVVKNRPRYAA